MLPFLLGVPEDQALHSHKELRKNPLYFSQAPKQPNIPSYTDIISLSLQRIYFIFYVATK